MYLRAKGTNDQIVNGRPVIEYGKENLYPNAFPFDRCGGNVAYVALTGSNPLTSG